MDERDSRYIRFKAGTSAALSRLNIGDLIKARAMAKDVMDFAVTSGRARALSMAHVAAGVINNTTGEPERAIAELERARDVAPDPVYRLMGEINLVGVLGYIPMPSDEDCDLESGSRQTPARMYSSRAGNFSRQARRSALRRSTQQR